MFFIGVHRREKIWRNRKIGYSDCIDICEEEDSEYVGWLYRILSVLFIVAISWTSRLLEVQPIGDLGRKALFKRR